MPVLLILAIFGLFYAGILTFRELNRKKISKKIFSIKKGGRMKRCDPAYPNLSDRCMKATERITPPLQHCVRRYLNQTMPARWYVDRYPDAVIDHATPRTKCELDQKAQPFILKGWRKKVVYEYPTDGWIAEVYIFVPDEPPVEGEIQPVLFVDRALPYHGEPDPHHVISRWIDEFPEEHPYDFLLHHIAVRVDDIYDTVREMESAGFPFARRPDGGHAVLSGYDGKLKQIFSQPEMLYGKKSRRMVAGTVFELIQRDPSLNDWDFITAQASELMMKQSVGR